MPTLRRVKVLPRPGEGSSATAKVESAAARYRIVASSERTDVLTAIREDNDSDCDDDGSSSTGAHGYGVHVPMYPTPPPGYDPYRTCPQSPHVDVLGPRFPAVPPQDNACIASSDFGDSSKQTILKRKSPSAATSARYSFGRPRKEAKKPNNLNLFEQKWMQRFEELKQYKSKHGNCNVPTRWNENQPLASWVHQQRQQHRLLKGGKKSYMTDEQIVMLESVGFEWSMRDQSKSSKPAVTPSWEKQFKKLQQHKIKHGDCNVPLCWLENPQLGQWVYWQRYWYRILKEGKNSSMTEEQVDMLEGVGFKWTIEKPVVPVAMQRTRHVPKTSKRFYSWEQQFEELTQYKTKYEDCNVPLGWQDNPQLGQWVNWQRYWYRMLKEGKNSSMTEERINLLESIGF